jgi:hypothetical protein
MATEQELNQLSLAEIRELAEQAERAAAEPEPVLYRRVVNGLEFVGESPEQLLDLISAAAEELAKSKAVPAPAEPVETPDSRFVEAQEWSTAPDLAFEKRFQKTVGMSPAQFKAREAKLRNMESSEVVELCTGSPCST